MYNVLTCHFVYIQCLVVCVFVSQVSRILKCRNICKLYSDTCILSSPLKCGPTLIEGGLKVKGSDVYRYIEKELCR